MTSGPAIAFEINARYPDPRVEILDERFLKLRLFSASVEQLATGMRWAEGPVWFGDGRYLLVSDIPNNRILRWDDTSGQVSEFRNPSNNANGLARDAQGRLLTCEHQTRRVTRTEYNGSITVLADTYQGKRLTHPTTSCVNAMAPCGSPIHRLVFQAIGKAILQPLNRRTLCIASMPTAANCNKC